MEIQADNETSQPKRQKMNDVSSKRNVRHCFCNIDAVSYLVKKEGPNKGRRFYTCAKTSSKCKYFKWSEDFDQMVKLSELHPDQQYIIQMEMQKRVKERFYPIYPILQNDNERASFFCVEKDRTHLIKKMVEHVYKTSTVDYAEPIETLEFHIDFRHNSAKVYCLFGKLNWSEEVEKKLKSFEKKGVLDYNQVISKLNYKKHEIDYEKVWIQLHGVEKNKKGWLFGGKANFIIVEIGPDHYILVERKTLVKYILNHCRGLEYVYPDLNIVDDYEANPKRDPNKAISLVPYDAHLSVYQPKTNNRHDAYCYITKDELQTLTLK